MSIELVTGHANEKHVSARDAAALNAAILGQDDYILEGGEQFRATVTDATTITIGTGELLMQGRHITSMMPTTLTLTPGTPGTRRIDRIVVTYNMDTMGIETAELQVLKGTPVAANATPTPPAITQGDLWTGATRRDYPLCQVTFDGVTPTVKVLPSNSKTMETIDGMGLRLKALDAQLGLKPVYLEPGPYWTIQQFKGVRIYDMVIVTAALTRKGRALDLNQWDKETLGRLMNVNSNPTDTLYPNPMHTWAAANNTGNQSYLIRGEADTLYVRDQTGHQVLNVGGWLQFNAIWYVGAK